VYVYVYLMPTEVAALARCLGLEEHLFRERYTQEDEGWTILRLDRPACPFLGPDLRCRVYAARPVQCRAWPFWEENLASPTAWSAAAALCPGIGRGPRIEAQEAREIARRMEQWYDPPAGSPGDVAGD